MRSATNAQLQQSAYFITPVAARTAAKQTASFAGARAVTTPHVVATDLSSIDPDGVVASSESLGWQSLRALEMRYTTSQWTMPPLENHCVIIQLGPSVDVTLRVGEHTFERRLNPGEIIIVPAGLPLHWSQRENAETQALHLYLHPNFLRTTAESIDFDYTQILIAPQFGIRDEHIRHIAMSLQCEMKESNVIGRHYADSLAKVLAMQLVRRYSYLKDLQTSRGGMAPRKLRRAIEFITENLDNEQTVALGAVAEAVKMSYFHFSRAFKQSTGVSPNTYMIEQRIDRAKKLLSETDLPIADIALRTGFASQSHFTTTFRKLVWTTPNAFREML
jgi:AraC family transcriptional regulator